MTIGLFLEKNRIREYIEKYNMINKGDGVVLGFSGGPDSECLFFVLLALRELYDLKLTCVHVNHMIRGEEADTDEEFVKGLCKEFNVPCKAVKIDIPRLARESGRSLEEEARMARYAEFDNATECLKKAGVENVKIAIAHNANDNAETVLFHMARGAGLDGMCGIAPVRGNIIRPLLKVKKEDIMEFLISNELPYCVDSTNVDTDYSRNRIRHNIITELTQVNDRALEHVFEMTEHLQKIKDFIELQAQGLLCMAKEEDGSLRKKTLLTAPEVLREQVIKDYLSKHMPDEKDVSQNHIDAVVALLNSEGEKTVDLPHGKKLIISYEKIMVKDQIEKAKSLGRLEFKEFSNSKGLSYPTNTYTKWFDCDRISGNIEFRTRKEGDYLTINSAGGTKTIQDYFVDEKIPKHLREQIPLVCDGNHVMWVVGHRISEYYKISDATTRIIEVKYMEDEA